VRDIDRLFAELPKSSFLDQLSLSPAALTSAMLTSISLT